MKRFGFTLAEVLITLGLIGVVAALTLPTLLRDTTSAQIGPKLAKAVSSFEQANEALLNSRSADSLSDAGLLDANNMGEYITELSNFFKISQIAQDEFLSKDGFTYQITLNNRAINNTLPAHRQSIGQVQIDINGANAPNIMGSDEFNFTFWNDGSLRPFGGTGFDETVRSVRGGNLHWMTLCPLAENGPVNNPEFCAGHIFENNLQVLYR